MKLRFITLALAAMFFVGVSLSGHAEDAKPAETTARIAGQRGASSSQSARRRKAISDESTNVQPERSTTTCGQTAAAVRAALTRGCDSRSCSPRSVTTAASAEWISTWMVLMSYS